MAPVTSPEHLRIVYSDVVSVMKQFISSVPCPIVHLPLHHDVMFTATSTRIKDTLMWPGRKTERLQTLAGASCVRTHMERSLQSNPPPPTMNMHTALPFSQRSVTTDQKVVH